MPVRGPKKSPSITSKLTTGVTTGAPTKGLTTKPVQLTRWGLPSVPADDGFSAQPKVNPQAVERMTISPSQPGLFDPQVKVAIDAYTERIRLILGHDAMSLARGGTAIGAGDTLNEYQQKQLKDAAVDLLKNLPTGLLAPEFSKEVQKRLASAHIQTRNIGNTKLKDLGDVGSDIAQSLIDGLKQKSPATFYSLAASAALAAGYMAWQGGSEKLVKLGIKPEFTTKLFKDHVNIKAGAQWSEHFKDFKAEGTVNAKYTIPKGGTVSAGVEASSVTGLKSANVAYRYDQPNWSLSTRTDFNESGFSGSRVDGRFHQYGVDATSYLSFSKGGFSAAGARVVFSPNAKLNVSTGVDYTQADQKLSMLTEVTYNPKKNINFALSGRADNKGSYWVGVGARLTF